MRLYPFLLLVFFFACSPDDQEENKDAFDFVSEVNCDKCCDEQPKTLRVYNDELDKEFNLTFYTAITPTNYRFCDHDQLDSSRIDSTCKPNPDTIFNYESGGLNDYFAIGGYSASEFKNAGFRSSLEIQTESGIILWKSWQRYSYGSNGAWFSGESGFEMVNGVMILPPIECGRYMYRFYVYDTLIDSEEVEREYLFDSISGSFCIIRNDIECDNSGCVGRDATDPLIH